MAYNYDALYGETPNALGQASQFVVEFFKDFPPNPITVLDVGCGQGRDAIFVAKLGHTVVGVDISPNGIADLEAAAHLEKLNLTGIVADITAFTPTHDFDVILFDRTLHMLPEAERHTVLQELLSFVRDGGWVLISDEKSNIPKLKSICDAHPNAWHLKREGASNVIYQRA